MGALALAVLPATSRAAVVQQMSLDDLAVEADRIVLGRIDAATSRWNADRSLIVTDLQVQTIAALKGDARAQTTVTLLGGTIEGLSLRATDTPIMAAGDAALLFLDDQDRLVGSFQGAFFTDGDVVARSEPSVHGIDDSLVVPLRDVADTIARVLGTKPIDDSVLRVTDAALPNNGRYVLLGQSWAYQGAPMGEQFFLNANAQDASAGPIQNQISSIFLGSSVWTDAGAEFEFDFGGATASTTDGFDGSNNIFFCPAGSCGMASSTLATTHIWFIGNDIVEWDMIFNDNDHTFWDGQTGGCGGAMYDIQAIAAHEFGHALGLGHSLDSAATMWFSVPPCVTSPRVLDQDDIDGLVAIYGDGGPPEVPFLFTGEASGDRSGFAVAGAGDVNNDGVEDLVVGAPYNDDNGASSGKVYIYSGATGTQLFALAGNSAGYRFGWSVDGAGDVNGDGFDDIIIGAPYASDLRGRVYVHSGSDGALLHQKNGASGTSERFGWSVAGGFDADDDGFSDFIVGAPYSNDAGTKSGKVKLFSGQDGSLIEEFLGENTGDRFGWSVDGIGRINGDNHDEFIVGAPENDDAGKKAGKVYIYSGRHLRTFYTLTGVQIEARFGTAVAGLGLADDDDKGDFVVASPYYDRGDQGEAGRIDVYSGRFGARLYSKKGENERDRLGWSVGPAGDVDGDGSADVAIGAPRHSAAGTKAGRVYIRSGATGGTIAIFDGDVAGDQLGYSVGSIGDVDADGTPELLMGAPFNDLAAGKAGRAYADLSDDRGARQVRRHAQSADDFVNLSPNTVAARRLAQLLGAWARDELLADVDGNDVVDSDDLQLIIARRSEY